MPGLLSYIFFGVVLYFIGGLIHDRYVYISDRRDWIEQGKSMACTDQDNSRLLAHLKDDVLSSVRQRAGTSNLMTRLEEIQFEITPFVEQRLTGEPFGMKMCTKEYFPWKQGKGGLNDGNCSMPAYLYCKTQILAKVPSDIAKEAELAARYLPLRQYGLSDAVSIGGQPYELFRITAGLSKTVPRYAQSRLYIEKRRDGTAPPEFNYNLGDLNGVIDNWLQFHEKHEQIMRSFHIANDIGGATTGGYLSSINRMKSEQVQLTTTLTRR